MNLSTATPREIDSELARLSGVYAQLDQARTNKAETAHRLNGERAVYKGRQRVYTKPLDETLNELALKLADEKIVKHEIDNAVECINRISDLDNQMNAVRADIQAIDAEYVRRPWSRFVSVEDGHVHGGARCAKGTIRVTTKIGWHPELSGKTEAEAVELLGPMLCTHCFPTAPVEYTVGKPKADHCEGSGKAEVRGTVKRRGMSVYGACTVCNTSQPLTQYGYVRKHKPKKD